MEVDERPAGVPDGWSVVTTPKAQEPSKGHDFKVLGVNIHVPAEEKARLDSNIVGWGENGAGIAPEDVLLAGQAGRRIVKAGPGIIAKALATVGEVAPMVKYEAVKTALRATGMPEPMAAIIAGAAVGYKGKGKAAAAETPAADAAHLDRSVPVPASSLTPKQLMERVRFGRGTPPAPVAKPPAGVSHVAAEAPIVAPESASPAVAMPEAPVTNALPDQKALNEAAIAARRAAYQAKLQAAGVPKSAAEMLAERMALPTDAEMKAQIASRHYKR